MVEPRHPGGPRSQAFGERAAGEEWNTRGNPLGFTHTSPRVAPVRVNCSASPRSRNVLATPFTPRTRGEDRSGLRHAATALRSLAVSALSGQCPDRAGRLLVPTMPSADFCTAVRSPRGSLSPDSGTQHRPPRLSLTTFVARPPDLQPGPSMDGGLCCLRSTRPTRTAYYPIPVRRATTLLHASFRRTPHDAALALR